MESNEERNSMNWERAAVIIGWIGLVLSSIGVPLLWFGYGDKILYVVLFIYGTNFTKIWLLHIILAFGEYFNAFSECK